MKELKTMLNEALNRNSSSDDALIQDCLNMHEIDNIRNRRSFMRDMERKLQDNGWKRCNLKAYMPDVPGNMENCILTKGEYKIAMNYYRFGVIVNANILYDFRDLDTSVYDKMPNKEATEEWFKTYKNQCR